MLIILNMVFIKFLELFKEILLVLLRRKLVSYMVHLVEYNLKVLLKVITQIIVLVLC